MANKTSVRILGAASLALGGGFNPAALADGRAGPDTSAWICERCPFADGLSGEISLGAGHVSDDGGDFQHLGGLETAGAYLALGTDLWYRNAAGQYVLVYGDRLGLDSRSLSIEAGQQGRVGISLGWQELPWIGPRDALTPFIGAGTANQSLPAGWVSPGNTADMTLLRPSLRPIDLGHERQILSLGAALHSLTPWRARVDARRIERDGTQVKGASFLFTGVEMVAPLRDETTSMEAALAYVRPDWQLEAAYQLSRYDHADRSVRWDNPFPAFAGGTRGELSLAPDNRFHQVMLSGFWRPGRSLNVAGQVAIGRATQDEAFLAPTLNAGLRVPALPVASLDGEVRTRIANFRINGHFTDRLRGRLVLRYDERDNATAQYPFRVVATDTFMVGPYLNQPYSFTRRSAEAGMDFRLLREVSLSASARRQVTERDFQEVSEAITDVFSLGARAQPDERLTLRAVISLEKRSNDLDPRLFDPFENPGLRRFHFAERERDLARFAADYQISERVAAGVFVEFAEERYTDTQIGLSSAKDHIIGFDLSASFGRHINASAFIAHETLQAEIMGADNRFGEPWRALTDDEFLTMGLSIDFVQLPQRWREGRLRLSHAQANGEIELAQRAVMPQFPELRTRRFLLEADVARELNDRLSLALSYVLARAREDDFYRDGVQVDTLPNYIALGIDSPSRTVHAVRLMLRYRFD